MSENTQSRVRNLRRQDGGFTLIELLIVIVILGVLAAIVVFSVRGITDRGDVSACKSNLKTAEVAVEAYYAKNGSNPASLAVLVDDFLKSDPSDASVDAKQRVGYTAGTGVGHARHRLRLTPEPRRVVVRATAALLGSSKGEPCTSTCTGSALGSTSFSTCSGKCGAPTSS